MEFEITARKLRFVSPDFCGDLIIYFGIAAIKLRPRAATSNHGPPRVIPCAVSSHSDAFLAYFPLFLLLFLYIAHRLQGPRMKCHHGY